MPRLAHRHPLGRRTWVGLLPLVFVCTLGVVVPASAQPAPARPQGPPPERTPRDVPPSMGQPGVFAPVVRVADETLESRALGRSIKYRVMLPPAYGMDAHRYPTLYLLHGLTGTYSDWERRSQLADQLARYDLVIVMPEGQNSWYTDAAAATSDRFETYIATDLVEDVEKKFQVIAARYGRAIAGLSMGGYGALKFGLKYPDKFAVVGSFSGAFLTMQESSSPPTTESGRLVRDSRQAAFGPPDSPARAGNDLMLLAEKAEPARMPYFYVSCGTEDGLIDVNREMVAVLHKRKIAYEYHESAGAHTWDYWDRDVRVFLDVLARRVPIAR